MSEVTGLMGVFPRIMVPEGGGGWGGRDIFLLKREWSLQLIATTETENIIESPTTKLVYA